VDEEFFVKIDDRHGCEASFLGQPPVVHKQEQGYSKLVGLGTRWSLPLSSLASVSLLLHNLGPSFLDAIVVIEFHEAESLAARRGFPSC